jgi:tellurite resistance protein
MRNFVMKQHPSSAGSPSTGHPADPAAAGTGRLAHLPIGVFAIIMGIGGASLAWRKAIDAIDAPGILSTALAWFALGLFVVIGSFYLAKVIRYPAAVRTEWRHPIAIAFSPATSIALLLLATAFLEIVPGLSSTLWWAGATAQLVLTLDVLRVWIADQRFQPQHVHPAWFIPMVGNLVVPLAGVHHASHDISWFFFGTGIVYWLALLAVVLNRLFVGGELPSALAPTLAILIAPPAVAALAWQSLGGSATDPVSKVLVSVAIFQAFLLLTQVRQLLRVPFALPAWALSFPLAALATVLLKVGHMVNSPGYLTLGVIALTVMSLMILFLVWRTIVAIRRQELCRPHP